MVDANEMVKTVYRALDDKKGDNIKILDISNVSVLADYFIIANGSNKSQVQALVDHVQEELHRIGKDPRQIEGYRTGNWILIDYGNIIVHVFAKEDRLFYDLERIWRDGKDVMIDEL
jgi:ribosome-associated protein